MQQNQLTAVTNHLDILLRQHRGRGLYATLDFDNTCIHHDVCEAVLAYVCEHALVKNLSLLPSHQEFTRNGEYARAVFRQYYNLLDIGKKKDAYLFAARALAGFTPAEVREVLKKTLVTEGTKLGSRQLFGREIVKGLSVRDSLREIMKLLVSRNIALWIVSASPEILVDSLSEQWFPEFKKDVIGIRSELDIVGRLTDQLVPPFPLFEGKVECIRHYIDPTERPVVALGDSANDQAMLEYANLRVVVDTKSDFAKEARKRGSTWYVIE